MKSNHFGSIKQVKMKAFPLGSKWGPCLKTLAEKQGDIGLRNSGVVWPMGSPCGESWLSRGQGHGPKITLGFLKWVSTVLGSRKLYLNFNNKNASGWVGSELWFPCWPCLLSWECSKASVSLHHSHVLWLLSRSKEVACGKCLAPSSARGEHSGIFGIRVYHVNGERSQKPLQGPSPQSDPERKSTETSGLVTLRSTPPWGSFYMIPTDFLRGCLFVIFRSNNDINNYSWWIKVIRMQTVC
jgi:hypothetical protein